MYDGEIIEVGDLTAVFPAFPYPQGGYWIYKWKQGWNWYPEMNFIPEKE